MIKRTLYFGNPAYLCLRDNQLVVKKKDGEPKTVPVEDVGFIILDSPQVTISCALLSFLTKNNCAVISCDSKHLPSGLFLPLAGNSLQSERFRHQIEASLPLKKQLWQQTVQQKILNQASVLQLRRKCPVKILFSCAGNVRSGDADNREAVAAAYYWKQLFPLLESFTRDRFGVPPNNIFNYGYAILRGVVARSLVASGLLPTFGIHHSNRYNAYCLADDIMEPYRPIVDKLIIENSRYEDWWKAKPFDECGFPNDEFALSLLCRRVKKVALSRGGGWSGLASIGLCGFWYFSICRRRRKWKGNAIASSARTC